jgi:hypothetical protein
MLIADASSDADSCHADLSRADLSHEAPSHYFRFTQTR